MEVDAPTDANITKCLPKSSVKRILLLAADVEVDEPTDDKKTKCIMCAREEDKEQLVTCTNCRTSGMVEHACSSTSGCHSPLLVTP